MLTQAFNIIIDHGVSAPVHGKEVLEGLNTTGKSLIFHLMVTVQLLVSQMFYTQMKIHTSTHNSDVSLDKKSQEKRGKTESIMCKNMKI